MEQSGWRVISLIMLQPTPLLSHILRCVRVPKKGESKPIETIENKRKLDGGGGGEWVMHAKEGTCEPGKLYVSDESLNSTPETNIT